MKAPAEAPIELEFSGVRGLTGRGGLQVCQLVNDRPPAWDALARAQMPAVWRQAATDWRRADGGVGGLMQLMGANQRRELQDIAVPSLSLLPQSYYGVVDGV